MIRITLAMVIFGGVMIYWGYQEMSLSAKADTTPQTITCGDLSDAGPGDNAHVEMTDFLLCSMSYVYETKGSNDSVYKTVWVPAVPLGGVYHEKILSMLDEEGNFTGDDMPVPKNLNVLVKTSDVSNDRDVMRLSDQDALTGLVINEIEAVDGEERRLLKESYPGVNFGDVWIIEHNRTPAGAGKTYGLMGGGAALLLLGIGVGAYSFGLIGNRG